MSDRADFLCKYAEKRLGRSLSDDEAKLISAETSRRAVQDLCDGFKKPVAKTVKTSKPKPKVIKDEE